MSSNRFRIALSFAGEKRDFVAKVAAILAKRFGEAAILYDEFHKAEFARDDLVAHLTNLYRNQSDLIVAVLCPNYNEKEWTGLEWKTIRGLLKQRKADEIMLTRFQHFEPETLEGLAGYIDLDHETPKSAAAIILERLAINEGKPKNYYTKPRGKRAALSAANIPNNLPRPQPFFGRETELKKNAESLAAESRGWGALVDGPGGIGKTALAIRAAQLVPAERFK
jgi:TIR domain